MNRPPELRRGTSADLHGIVELLVTAGLPTADLADIEHLDTWVLNVGSSLVGAVALERYGSEGLLRSLVVAPEHRKRGYAARLVDRLETDARAAGIERLVLLTETAEAFFGCRGYGSIDRNSVSESLRQSAEFRSLCPVSARCMSKQLRILS